MRFSIITCTYNSEKFLRENLESVKKQTFKDLEHIFIDGFSYDKTKEIIFEYKKSVQYPVYFFQHPPKGIADAFNKGIYASNGEYLFFLNSDDYFYDENVLRDINNFLQKNPEYDWIYGLVSVIQLDGKTIGKWPRHWYLHYSYKNIFGKYFLKYFNFIPHQGVFIKREIFKKFGLFDENLKYLCDAEYWLRIRSKTKWTFVNRTIANYRWGGATEQNLLEAWKIYFNIQKKYSNFFELLLIRIFNKIIFIKQTLNHMRQF
ncbi:MAG: glycosyltransferase family 2 protein [Candidatus Aenigmatarchaeota archaeon]